jgi:hypothetical protein
VNVKSEIGTVSEHEDKSRDAQEESGEIGKEETDQSPPLKKPTPMLSEGNMVDDSPHVEKSENEAVEGAGGDHGTREPEIYIGEPADTHKSSSDAHTLTEETIPVEAATSIHTGEVRDILTDEPAEELTEEEEETARRKRVVEKLGKMGGFNPLAPPPPPPLLEEVEAKDIPESDAVERPISSPTSTRTTFETARQSSKDSTITGPVIQPSQESSISPPPSSESEAPARKGSIKPVESGNLPELISQEDGEY